MITSGRASPTRSRVLIASILSNDQPRQITRLPRTSRTSLPSATTLVFESSLAASGSAANARAATSNTTAIISQRGMPRWFSAAKTASIRAIRHLAAAEDETRQQQDDGGVRRHHQHPAPVKAERR